MSIRYYVGFLGVLFFSLAFGQPIKAAQKETVQELVTLSNDAIHEHSYNQAIEYSLRLINLAKEKGDDYHLYHGYNNLGYTYYDLNDTVRAKENYQKALETAQRVDNDTLLWWAYNNLGSIYSENEETVEKGFEYYDRVIEIAKRMNDPEILMTPLLNKGWTYIDIGEYDKAYPYLVQVDSLAQNMEDTVLEGQLALLFGRYYSGKNQIDRAKEYFEEAINITTDNSSLSEAAEAYSEYSDMLFRNEEYEKAYRVLEKYVDINARLYEKEKLEQMETAQARFQTDQYKQNLEVVQREQKYKDEVISKSQQISVIMVISLLVMFLFLVLLLRSNSIRKRLIGQLRENNRELKEAKEEAEKLSMLKSRFFSTVSHEIRTPLYGVVGLTSLLLEDNKDKEREEDLKSLKFSADYLLALINDVLQMNKMESKLVHLENTPFNIKDLMKGIIKSFEFTRHQNKNCIELGIDDQIPKKLIGDSVRLSQILMNLLGNAIKFTERGKVWIKARCENCEDGKCLIYFEVGDTGMGIPANKQQEIFEEFSQLKANNYNYQGTGLGLPIVKNLLTLFDSEIRLKSEEGKGSVFSFEILFERGESPEEEPEVQNATETSDENVMRKALIVDDNRINRIVTQRILEKRDFQCRLAGDGYEAIEILKTEAFGVVLMDVNMPGMSGMETTQKIREFNETVPVIALTAVEIQEMREEILASGMNDIIVKPYDIPTFFNTIYRNLLAPVKS